MAHFGGDTLANGVLGWQYRCMAWDEGFSSQDHAQEVFIGVPTIIILQLAFAVWLAYKCLAA